MPSSPGTELPRREDETNDSGAQKGEAGIDETPAPARACRAWFTCRGHGGLADQDQEEAHADGKKRSRDDRGHRERGREAQASSFEADQDDPKRDRRESPPRLIREQREHRNGEAGGYANRCHDSTPRVPANRARPELVHGASLVRAPPTASLARRT